MTHTWHVIVNSTYWQTILVLFVEEDSTLQLARVKTFHV